MRDTDAVESDGGNGREPRVTPSEAAHLAANKMRRVAIRELCDSCRNHCMLGDIIDAIEDEMDADRRKIELAIHHDHLPRLAEHGVVEYDNRNGDIRYRPSPRVEKIVDSLHEDD